MKTSLFVILFFLSFLVAVVFVTVVPQPSPHLVGDSFDYINIGTNILKGNGFSADGVTPTTYRPPVYPFLLAGIFYLFGEENWSAVRLFNAICHGTTAGVSFCLGSLFMPISWAFVLGLAVSLNPYFIFNTGFILQETLLTTLTVISFWILVKNTEEPSPITSAASGISWGLLTLNKSVSLLYPFLFLIVTIWHWSKRRRILFFQMVWIVVFIVVLIPWTIRNYLVTRRFLIVNSQMGWVFFTGTVSNQVAHWGGLPEQKAVSEEIKEKGITNPVDADSYYTKKAFKNIVNYPLKFLRLVAERVIRFVAPDRFWLIVRGYSSIGGRSFGYFLAFLVNVIVFGTVFPNLIFSIRSNQPGLFAISSGVLYCWVVYSAIFVVPRFNVSSYPLALINAFIFVRHFIQRFVYREREI